MSTAQRTEDTQGTGKKASQIERQLEAINGALKRLVGRIDDLASDLRLVLIPVPPMGESKPSTTSEPTLVPLAEELHSIRRRIDASVDRILAINERCEL